MIWKFVAVLGAFAIIALLIIDVIIRTINYVDEKTDNPGLTILASGSVACVLFTIYAFALETIALMIK